MTDSRPRIGDHLVAAGLLKREQLESGTAFQRAEGGFLSDVLVRHGLIEEAGLLRHLASASGAKYLTAEKLAKAKIEHDVLEVVPVRLAERLCVLPIAYDAPIRSLTLAVPEPSPDLYQQIKSACGLSQLVPIVALRMAIRAGIRRFYYSDAYAFASMDAIRPPVSLAPQPPAPILARSKTFLFGLPPAAGVGGDFPGDAHSEITPPFQHKYSNDEPTDIRRQPTRPAAMPVEPAPPDPIPLSRQAEQSRREAMALRMANELAVHLVRERNLTDLLHRLLAFAFDRFPADDGVVLLLDPAHRRPVPHAVRTRVGDTAQVVVSETLVGEVISTHEGVLTMDAAMDERFRAAKSIALGQTRGAMAVPLFARGEVRGVLYLASRGKTGSFSPVDLEVLTALASMAGAFIEAVIEARRVDEESAGRRSFARILSPALVEEALSGAMEIRTGGENHVATVLVARLRGVEQVARRGAEEVVSMINERFDLLAEVVFSHGGMVEQVAPADLTAIWGPPAGHDDDPARAVRAALEMCSRSAAADKGSQALGRPPLDLCCGVATGLVVFGSFGPAHRRELSAVGEGALAAAKLGELAEPGEVLASESTLMATGWEFQTTPLDKSGGAGRSRSLRAHRVHSAKR